MPEKLDYEAAVARWRCDIDGNNGSCPLEANNKLRFYCISCRNNAARVGLALMAFKEGYDQAVEDALKVQEAPHA